MVELFYKFDKNSTASVRKCESTAKVPFKLFWGLHTHIHKGLIQDIEREGADCA